MHSAEEQLRKHPLRMYADNTVEIMQPPKSGKFTLEEMQQFVGGYIQIFATVIPDMVLVTDEEGRLRDKPVNENATTLYLHGRHDFIVGDVLFCTRKQAGFDD
jgi:hypothetical protein